MWHGWAVTVVPVHLSPQSFCLLLSVLNSELLPRRPSHLYVDFSIRDLYAKYKLHVTWPANIYIEIYIYIYAQIYSELSFLLILHITDHTFCRDHDALNVLEQPRCFLYSLSMLSLLPSYFSRLCLLSHPNQENFHANTRFHY